MVAAGGVSRLGRVVGWSGVAAPLVVVGRMRVLPVAAVGVVAAEAEAAPVAGGGQLADKVAAAGGIDAVEIPFVGWEERAS